MDEVAELFRGGLSIRQIAKRVGVSFSVVRAQLIRKGLHHPKSRYVCDGLVVCKRCGLKKTSEEFPGLVYSTYRCRECLAIVGQQNLLLRDHRVIEAYQSLLESQGGQCAICGIREGHRSCRGRICRLAIDHDHGTGIVRGLLCNNCNRGLGRFKDSVALLEAAVRYLKREQ